MIKCNRCNEIFPDRKGTFWSEPVLACSTCGARHQRESRASRGIGLLIILPFLTAALVGWTVSIWLLVRAFKGSIWSWGWVAVFLGLIGLCTLLTYHVVSELRGMAAPREIECQEK